MLCTHCGQEHPDSQRVCPNTGLPLGQQVVCVKCGQAARPGSRFCASCGEPLPRPQPPEPSKESNDGAAPPAPGASPVLVTPPPPAPVETHPTLPAGSQHWTRPSVSLVERSRRETRPAWIAIPTSPRAAQQWARQSRRWQLFGYALLALVLLAGGAGLLLLWSQLRPQSAALPSPSPTLPALAERSSDTPAPSAAILAPSIAPPRPTATSRPSQAAPTTTPADLSEVAMPGAGSSSPADASTGRLAFYSTRDEGPGIYVLDLERPEEPQVLPLPEGYDIATWPAFCGEQVAFEAQDRALTLPRWIYLYNLTDQSLRPLELADPAPLRLSAPTCSPDGRYLAFSAYQDGDWGLVVTDLNNGKIIYRLNGPEYPQLGHASFPLSREAMWWMGTRVNGFYDINRTQDYLEGQPGTTQPFAQGKYPAISPDGSRLAFFCGNLLHLCVAGTASGEILFQMPVSYFKRVNDLPVPATASWSSDGGWLYFTSSITGNWDIYRVRADGSQAQNLTETWRTDEFMPAAR